MLHDSTAPFHLLNPLSLNTMTASYRFCPLCNSPRNFLQSSPLTASFRIRLVASSLLQPTPKAFGAVRFGGSSWSLAANPTKSK